MNEEKKYEKQEEIKVAAVEVTAIHDVDFPELGWGINAGEKRKLPEDKKSQTLILSNSSIRIIK